ncbi:hypothetical protein DFJ58DRAFT_840648 [Suillus subalutaceus]|uniref:uncharacterized protein n=1 Tax=Suillus subalutaceus TaxID=48586 RepID=UPI001B86A576|nr:uncharacterized protein DFJ58DRAFT_840648 [Suillus subalutaceus]KAG1857354.1 hypothetical protein DFJ58DRAFT_840648 [Suillus subalutaceus]
MSSFVPGHFGEYPPPLGEGPSHLECPQDPDQTNLVISEILQVTVNNSMLDPLDDTLQALCEEPSHPGRPQDPGETHLGGVEQVVITVIRATDLALGLRRIPAGFSVVVKTDSAEFQTSNKLVHVDQAVVEWNEPILLETPGRASHLLKFGSACVPRLNWARCSESVMEKSSARLRSPSENYWIAVKSHIMLTSITAIIFQPKQGEVVSTFLLPITTLTFRDMDALVLKTDAGHCLLARYCKTQNSMDIDQSIKHFERASDLCHMDHPYRPAALLNLATTKFAYADAAEESLSEVLDVCHTDSHIHRAALLAIKTSALHPAGNTDASDLGQERPVASMLPLSPDQLARRAARCLQRDDDHDLYDTMHPFRGQLLLLCNLSMVLSIHFECQGSDKDLDWAIALQREALALCPVGHTDRETLALYPVGHTERYKPLHNLAHLLCTRFDQQGNGEDLDQAITLQREAVALCPVGHPDRSLPLDNLAKLLCTRLDQRGNGEDLDQAIALHREALALCPVGHTDRSLSLNNLAAALYTHFHHRGNGEDLDEAFALQREALAPCPVGHTDRSMSLNNLANLFSTRFDHRGSGEDLDQAIELQREALALRPVGHTGRSMSLSNLVLRLSARFDYRRNDEDLDQAIALQSEALALRPVGHKHRSMSLSSLANRLSARFAHRGNDKDLDQAIALHREALVLRPVGHTDRSSSLSEDTGNLNAAMHHFKAAANVVSGASVSSRHNAMKNFPNTLAVDAASCALRSGDVCHAVELLEQGRTVIWTQMTRLRTPLDSLQTRGDHAVALMKRFRDLSSLLDKPPASHPEGSPIVAVEAEETRYRRLVEDWNRAVEEIRKIEGFSRFLLPPLFSDLQDAARDGPIIVLIASKSSCDTIIIPYQQPPTSIQLPTNLEKLQTLVVKLQCTSGEALTKVLVELWDDVVRSVVEKLGGFAP